VTDSFVQYAAADRIATLTLNRPESRNAIGAQQDCQDVIDAVRRAEEDAGVSCIVLTGAGASFCAGGNLKGMQSRSGIGRLGTPEATRANYRRGVQRMIRTLWDCEVPMVAAVNGHAIGLGLDLACVCDVRLAAETAKFASSFIKVGIVPGRRRRVDPAAGDRAGPRLGNDPDRRHDRCAYGGIVRPGLARRSGRSADK
jgi:2-(1,2-epoxy-1,2-dihydrophenyl)acetyl-CoA isomerase